MKRNTQSTRGKTDVSEIVGNFSFGSEHSYADNDEYVSKNLAFDVLAIAREPGRGYDGKDRWALTVKAADRDCEILTLGCNPKRDKELAAAQAHCARGGTIKNKRLHRSGSAFYLRDGDR
ncbi:MAG TPA: hypothetical protein VGX91_11240 [Candidatus Cybelea sp.]|jgi:hypothetical protein|nr:hypothetical protein [Candidatus Cybelea sp.]